MARLDRLTIGPQVANLPHKVSACCLRRRRRRRGHSRPGTKWWTERRCWTRGSRSFVAGARREDPAGHVRPDDCFGPYTRCLEGRGRKPPSQSRRRRQQLSGAGTVHSVAGAARRLCKSRRGARERDPVRGC